MRNAPFALAAVVVALSVAGVVGAQFVKTHTMAVRLPDGGEAHVFYSGNAPPPVVFGPAARPMTASWPGGLDLGDTPLAEMDRVSAEMDREAEMMLRDEGDPVWMIGQPTGAPSYSFVSTLPGSGFCSRGVEIIADGHGDKPRVFTRTTGDCGAPPRPNRHTIERAPGAPAPGSERPAVIAARYDIPTRS